MKAGLRVLLLSPGARTPAGIGSAGLGRDGLPRKLRHPGRPSLRGRRAESPQEVRQAQTGIPGRARPRVVESGPIEHVLGWCCRGNLHDARHLASSGSPLLGGESGSRTLLYVRVGLDNSRLIRYVHCLNTDPIRSRRTHAGD
jgi:hypothetical protein